MGPENEALIPVTRSKANSTCERYVPQSTKNGAANAIAMQRMTRIAADVSSALTSSRSGRETYEQAVSTRNASPKAVIG